MTEDREGHDPETAMGVVMAVIGAVLLLLLIWGGLSVAISVLEG